ncbi:hypothetical protein TSOC_008640 [Tetrabaena socialis]|uniref:Uncharacterized protein n=1 Tax=Tetrabaena socialis TaxID=47790 RepID=A0A2J7ZXY7_9CHLO|nr:hypothetical protein TSOC_008640 [Tetrabaena socialis]|eukprot:PNH05131.1 hypothetical protein TSOC_008640 [Tetrabaena socialis]
MATARERVQSLDSRLRELEERFIGINQSTPLLPPLPDLASTGAPAAAEGDGAASHRSAWPQPTNMSAPRAGAAPGTLAWPAAAQPLTADAPPAEPQPALPPRANSTHAAPAPVPLPPRPSKATEVPLRLYREGLPHRGLGPPQSVWEADKNTAVVALSDRVRQLEGQLHDQQQQHQQHQHQPQSGPEGDPGAGAQHAMPPPTIGLLPVPRTVLGGSSHANVAPFDGIHAAGRPPAPVKYYPPPPPGHPLSAEAALLRLQTAQGARGHARAFAASVTASATATVPSVMMRRNENAQPPRDYPHPHDAEAAGRGGGVAPGAVGVSAPLGYASVAASGAASLHSAALREPGGPLQPAGRYPMVAAALAAGAPGSGGSTWEQAKMRALVSLEQERDMLRAQLESYRDVEDRHRREMVALNEQHREDLRDAAGIAGRRLDRLMGSAGQLHARRALVLRVSRALHAWRRIAVRNRRLGWAGRVWRKRALEAAFAEWHMLVLACRRDRQSRRRAAARYLRTLLLAWGAAAASCLRLRRMGRRAALLRCRWLLAAWARRTAELRARRLRVQGAVAHRRRALLWVGWRGLAAEVVRRRAAEALLRQRLARGAVVAVFATWLHKTRLAQRLRAQRRRAVLRCVLRSWARHASQHSVLRRKLRGLHASWRRRRRAILLAAWAEAARRLARLGAADRALRAAVRRQALSGVLACLRLPPLERAWGRRRAAVALRAWHAAALRAARNRRIAVVRRQQRSRGLLGAAFDEWRVLAKTRMVRLHLREIHRLQEHQRKCVKVDMG